MDIRMRAVAGLAGAALLVLLPSATAEAATGSPPQVGCPTGWEAVSVSAAVAEGYFPIPVRVDDPANGGNGDGTVCRKAVNEVQRAKFCATVTCLPGLPIYTWSDNFRAAS